MKKIVYFFIFLLLACQTFGAEKDSGLSEKWIDPEPQDLKAQIDGAPMLKIEEVCQPVKTARMEGSFFVPNTDSKTYDVLLMYYPDYGTSFQLFALDCATGKVTKTLLPPKRYVHICGKALGPDGLYYFNIYSPADKKAELWVYNPESNRIKKLDVTIDRLGGEKHPLVPGTDGKLYGGGTRDRTAAVFQYDTETGNLKDFGNIGPSHAPHGCWCYSMAADERYIYAASGKIPWYLIAYDRKTGKETILLTNKVPEGHVHVKQHTGGCSASSSAPGKDTEYYWLYRGKVILKKNPKEKPPWKETTKGERKEVLPAKPELFLSRAVPLNNSEVEIWYRNPGEEKRKVSFSVDIYPLEIYRVKELPDGRIFGTAGSYQGNFIYDPATGKSVHLGKIALSHYSTAIYDGKIYMNGYPGSPLYLYDPSKPWTANTGLPGSKPLKETDKNSNPRLLVRLRKYAGTHKMYAAAVGSNGKIYFGGRWARSGNGGGLAWWDPKLGKGGGFWEPFSNFQITYMTGVDDGKYLVISTRAVSDPLMGKPKTGQGRLFIFDTGKAEIIREIEPVMKAENTGPVAGVGKNRVLGITQDPDDPKKSTVLYGVDVLSGKVLFQKKIPFRLAVGVKSNQREPFDYRLGPDGWVWTFINNRLVRINPDNAEIEVLGRVKRGGKIAFSGNDIYLSNDARLRKIPNLRGRSSNVSTFTRSNVPTIERGGI